MTVADLKSAMRAEEAARLSDETQRLYGEAEAREDTDWLEVTEALQLRVLTAAGVSPERMRAALFLLRCGAQLFPRDEEMQQLSLYVRHNRASAGNLTEGDALVDVPLYTLPNSGGDSAPTSLRKACANGGLPTLVVGGSFT